MDINISNYLRLDVVDMIMVLVSTLILCLFAKHFFWDYVSDYFQKRHDAIAADLKAGADAKAEGENYRQQYEQQLAGAKGEAREIIEAAQKHANEERKEVLAKAREEADMLKAKTKQDMEREKAQAQQAMKQTIVDVALEAAKAIVKKEMDESKQQAYVDDFIEHAGDDTWQA